MRKHFPKLILLTLLFLPVLAACVTSANDPKPCILTLRAAIHQGPSTGVTLAGDLHFKAVGEQGFGGSLILESGLEIATSGQVQGHMVHLVFDLGEGNQIYAVGTSQNPYIACQGSAGGQISGPQPGDSGDWFGEWRRASAPKAPVSETGGRTQTELIMYVTTFLGFAIIILVATLWFVGRRLTRPAVGDEKPVSGRTVEPEPWPGEVGLPVAQFVSEYQRGDELFDPSFSIELRGQFLGECGVAISSASRKGQPKQAIALETWIFDKNDINTVTKMLMTEGAYNHEPLRERLGKKGETLLLQAGETIPLETKTLRLLVEIEELEYTPQENALRSIIESARLKLGVWQK